jgi:hypothetical protein
VKRLATLSVNSIPQGLFSVPPDEKSGDVKGCVKSKRV